jgi:hypothetical protein
LEGMTRGIRLLLWLSLLLCKWVVEMRVVIDHQMRLEMLHLHPRRMRLQALTGMRRRQRCPKIHPYSRSV